jgi:SAM-dependent methyltransferase
MVAEALVAARCIVCSDAGSAVICRAVEVRAHMEYLLQFHGRRLHPGPGDGLLRSALADRARFTQDYATDIVGCKECGSVFRSPRPPDAAILRAYIEDRYGHRRLAALFEGQRALQRRKARYLRRWLPTGRRLRVVEVGSFVGGFLAAGMEQGWETLGVDPGREVNQFCGERGLPVFPGTLPEARFPAGSVDCVAIWNTLDQMPDPGPTLAAARRLLRPGGILAVRVPNGNCFRLLAAGLRHLTGPWNRWLRTLMAWNNLLAFPYLHGYSVRALGRLLAGHGFEQIAVCPDTLVRLSDGQTAAWAAWEERALKSVCRLAAGIEALLPDSTMATAPWFDAYYRVPA